MPQTWMLTLAWGEVWLNVWVKVFVVSGAFFRGKIRRDGRGFLGSGVVVLFDRSDMGFGFGIRAFVAEVAVH